MVQTSEAALTEVANALVSIRQLAIHAANEGANDEDVLRCYAFGVLRPDAFNVREIDRTVAERGQGAEVDIVRVQRNHGAGGGILSDLEELLKVDRHLLRQQLYAATAEEERWVGEPAVEVGDAIGLHREVGLVPWLM